MFAHLYGSVPTFAVSQSWLHLPASFGSVLYNATFRRRLNSLIFPWTLTVEVSFLNRI